MKYLYGFPKLVIVLVVIVTFLSSVAPPVSAAPTVVTIGATGDYPTVADAISNGAIVDGVNIIFVSDVFESNPVVLRWNVTIDGNGYTWNISSPFFYDNGLLLIDTTTHKTYVTIGNLTITAGSYLRALIYSNTTFLSIENTVVASDQTGTRGFSNGLYYIQDYPGHKWLYLKDTSIKYIRYAGIGMDIKDRAVAHIQMDNLSLYGTASTNGRYGIVVLTRDYSKLVMTSNNIFLEYIRTGLYFYAVGYSSLNTYFFDTNLRYSSINGFFAGSYDNATVNTHLYGVTATNIKSLVEVESTSYSSTHLKNVYVDDASSMLIYTYFYSGTHWLTVDDLQADYVSGDAFNVMATSGNLRMDVNNVFIGYAGSDGIEYDDYGVRDARIRLSNVTFYDNGDEAIDLYMDGSGYTLFSVDGLYVDDTGWDAIDLYSYKDIVDLYFLNTYFYHVDDDLLDGYIENTNINMVFDGLVVDWHTEDEGIDLYTYNITGNMIFRNFYIDETDDDNIRIYNDYPRGVYIELYNAYLPDYHGLHISSSPYSNVTFYASYSYIRSIYLYKVNGTFHETYFNEAYAPTYMSFADVEWTYNVLVLSNITNLPVRNAKVTLMMSGILMGTGTTNDIGVTDVFIRYNISSAYRGVPNLKIYVEYQGDTYVFDYNSAYASPSWYRTFVLEIPVKAVSVKLKGMSELGMANLSFDENGGTMTVTTFLDPLNPANNRIVSYEIKVESIVIQGSYIYIDILVDLSTGASSNWLPTKIIIDTANGHVFVYGPIMFIANY